MPINEREENLYSSYFGVAVVIIGTVTKIETANAYPLNPQAPIVFGGDLHMVESADFNHDGKNDLVVTDGKTFRGIGLLYGNGNGTFQLQL